MVVRDLSDTLKYEGRIIRHRGLQYEIPLLKREVVTLATLRHPRRTTSSGTFVKPEATSGLERFRPSTTGMLSRTSLF
jgi:hypothetical protein